MGIDSYVSFNRYLIMKKIIQRVVLILFTLLLIFLIQGMLRKISFQRQKTESIASLPSFSFMTLLKDDFHSSDIKQGPVLIVRFHRECEHCQYEISQILASDIPSVVANLLLISSDNPDSISKFLQQFNYSDYPSVIVLADTSDSFSGIFGKDIVPSNYIYNKKLKLVKIHYGEVKTETILKNLQISE